MKKKSLTILFAFTIALLSFIAGGFVCRAGVFSTIKQSLISLQPIETPTTVPEIEPSFSFEFLNNPSLASLNRIRLDENSKPLKFLVAGHIYDKLDESSSYPAMTLLANLALFREEDFDMLFLLGDIVWNSTNENFENLEKYFLTQVKIPIFNAVGNHDVARREIYEERYGSTVYAFEYKQNLFIILDTNLKYYDLTSDEVTFIKSVITDKLQTKNITHIHILMHHVLFLEDEEIIGKQVIKPNSGDGASETFRKLIEDVLYPASASAPLHIYAGDVGAFGNLSPLYKKSETHPIYFFATGLGNNEEDSVLIVEENLDSTLSVTPFSLSGNEMLAIEDYNFEYWLKQ